MAGLERYLSAAAAVAELEETSASAQKELLAMCKQHNIQLVVRSVMASSQGTDRMVIVGDLNLLK